MHSVYHPHGSAPPGEKIFSCIRELNGKPYSNLSVEECLKEISAKSFVQQAWIRNYNSEDNRIQVDFSVKTRLLKVEELTFDMKTEEEAELWEWLMKNPSTLRVGGSYTLDAESRTWEGVRQFYRTRGVSVAVTPTEILDYDAGKARLNFRIILGPAIPSEAAFPPYGKRCNDLVVGTDESQVDENVPRIYVESKIELIRGYPCFTPEVAQRDIDSLKALPILESVAVEYTGGPGDRKVSYKLKGKPLTIRHVTLRGFGSPTPCLETAKTELCTKPGAIYQRSVAEHTARDLEERLCARPGYWTEVTEQDEPLGDNQIDVTFNVLVDPPQTLIINGSKIE
ncbi:MAG TPA: hypothetical protein VJX70_08425 [Candidatus Acidoferrum sp.]|nr:hypothetical protein [Candidatus Acidoferrum sp.]